MTRSSRRLPNLLPSLLSATVAFSAQPALAQVSTPIGPYVVDVRGAVPAYPDGAAVADPRGLTESEVPGHGLGVEAGVHVYPWRRAVVTFGVGVGFLWSRGTATPELVSDAEARPSVTTKLGALTPQVSLNFGTGRGWSYISGGLGAATLSISRSDLPEEDGQTTRAWNYGGGARWFVSRRLAFTFDLRYYALDGKSPSGGSLGFPKTTLFAAGAGVSFR